MIRRFLQKNSMQNERGMIIIQTLVFSAIVVMIIGALSGWASTTVKAGRIAYNREQAFQAAEAGIDYYRWHLAHAPSDYEDGTGEEGPYVHDLKDRSGNKVAEFSLDITPPPIGSTVVTIKSTGSSVQDSSATRIIESRVAKPSIAKYAVAGNNAMRFGAGTEVFGPIHVNGGIRFDGLAHNLVTSGTTYYTDTDSDACVGSGSSQGVNSYGVHTCLSPEDPAYPGTLPSRPDVFEAGRLIGQPTIDFSGFTTDLATLKTNANASGFYRGVAGGSAVGYRVVLKTNDTFDLYRINSWTSLGSHSCSASSGVLTWNPNSQTLLGNYAFPSNGIIFLEDNVVVEGQINGARLTITAADMINPIVAKSIYINNDITYTYYDGTDAIGLIGQSGVIVGLVSDTNLQIDAALIAQTDRVGRFRYTGSNCSHKSKDTITLFGMIASYVRYGFAYTDGTGYDIRNITYDANLLYAPPPNFPLTSSNYEIISWQEVRD